MKLLILDRDGVINEDSDAYIKSLDEWIPIPGSIDAIARLSKAGWTVAVATNQSGLARGYYNEATLESMHSRLRQLVAEQRSKGVKVECAPRRATASAKSGVFARPKASAFKVTAPNSVFALGAAVAAK